MSDEKTLITPFLSAFMTLIFVFSTVFTLAFFYYQGASQQFTPTGLSTPKDPTSLDFFGVLNAVLNVLAWISPFAIVRALFLFLMPSDLFLVTDMLFLRPISWIVAVFTANYIKSWIPTESGEL